MHRKNVPFWHSMKKLTFEDSDRLKNHSVQDKSVFSLSLYGTNIYEVVCTDCFIQPCPFQSKECLVNLLA